MAYSRRKGKEQKEESTVMLFAVQSFELNANATMLTITMIGSIFTILVKCI